MQPKLAQQVLQMARQEDIHTAVESCLHVPWHYIEPSLAFVDLWRCLI